MTIEELKTKLEEKRSEVDKNIGTLAELMENDKNASEVKKELRKELFQKNVIRRTVYNEVLDLISGKSSNEEILLEEENNGI